MINSAFADICAGDCNSDICGGLCGQLRTERGDCAVFAGVAVDGADVEGCAVVVNVNHLNINRALTVVKTVGRGCGRKLDGVGLVAIDQIVIDTRDSNGVGGAPVVGSKGDG